MTYTGDTPDSLMEENMVMLEFLCYLNRNGHDFEGQKINRKQNNGGCYPDFRIVVYRDVEGVKTTKVAGYAEVKVREYSWDEVCRMGGPLMHKDKYDMLLDIANKGYASAIVMKFKCGTVGFWSIKEADVVITKGGRKDRGIPKDYGEVVIFKPDQMTLVANLETEDASQES